MFLLGLLFKYMKHKYSVFLLLITLLLIFISYFIPSLKTDSNENRTLATFDMVIHPNSESVVYRDSAVERLDEALSDQFAFRDFFVNKYLKLINNSEKIMFNITKPFLNQNNSITLHGIGEYWLINDTGVLVGKPIDEPLEESEAFNLKLEQLEYIHKRYPDLKMYYYYTSRITDMSWFSEQSGIETIDYYKYIDETIPNYIKRKKLIYRDMEDYLDVHYITDHHWNHRGYKKGYEDIYTMMSEDFSLSPMLIPTNENNVSETYDFKYTGRYARALGDAYTQGYDSFSFYEYDYPDKKMFVIESETMKEIEIEELCLYDEYRSGEINKDKKTDHYIALYAYAKDANNTMYCDQDYAFVIYNTIGNGKNILITGDSYIRPIRELIAAHFDTTVCVDYRVFSKYPIDYLIEKYNIDVLLISSHLNTWRELQYLYTFVGEK